VMTVPREEFLRRFLLHLLPKGFVRIRATSASSPTEGAPPCCHRASPLSTPLHRNTKSETSTAPTAHPLWRCPKCGGPMALVERLTAAQLQLRSQPLLATAA
jgi:hypothetical protein